MAKIDICGHFVCPIHCLPINKTIGYSINDVWLVVVGIFPSHSPRRDIHNTGGNVFMNDLSNQIIQLHDMNETDIMAFIEKTYVPIEIVNRKQGIERIRRWLSITPTYSRLILPQPIDIRFVTQNLIFIETFVSRTSTLTNITILNEQNKNFEFQYNAAFYCC